MADLQPTRWIVWLWICSMLSHTSEVSGDCSDDRLTAGGGAALANSGQTLGCHNECPTTGHQVHVISQIGGDPAVSWMETIGRRVQAWPMITIHMDVQCTPVVPVILVLICQEVIFWKIKFEPTANPLRIIVYKPQYSTVRGDFGGILPEVFNIPQSGLWDGSHSVIEYLKSSHQFPTITSSNTAERPSQWNLGICCSSQTKGPPLVTGSGEDGQGEMDPSISASTFSTVVTTVTDQAVSRNKTQVDGKESDTIPLVAGLVSLLVVVGAGIACAALCLYRQKTKSSLTSGTSPSADPNIYSQSPTVTVCKGITHDRPPSYGEVEYEEAASVTPPVIPPRDKRL